MEFFGPFPRVNGIIWPYLPMEARQYRLRLLNGSNARFYRLVLLDEQGNVAPGTITPIGTAGGFLGQPFSVPQKGLILAPAQPADPITNSPASRSHPPPPPTPPNPPFTLYLPPPP